MAEYIKCFSLNMKTMTVFLDPAGGCSLYILFHMRHPSYLILIRTKYEMGNGWARRALYHLATHFQKLKSRQYVSI